MAILTRKAERNLFIPISYFPDDISKFNIITLLDILENDFSLFNFLGFLNGEREEIARITSFDDEKFYALKKIVQDQVSKTKPIKKHRAEIGKVIFDDESATLKIDGKIIQLPPYKNEHYFCRAMFKYNKNEPVEFSDIEGEIVGMKMGDKKDSWRIAYDTMRKINKRVAESLNTDSKLFTLSEETVRRNY